MLGQNENPPQPSDGVKAGEPVERHLAESNEKTRTQTTRLTPQGSNAACSGERPFTERVARVQREATAAGLRPRDTDDKEFLDELWGED